MTKIPVDVLRAAWIAGVLEKRSFVAKSDPMRKLWKSPEELWTAEEAEYEKSMGACARVIEEYLAKTKGAGK